MSENEQKIIFSRNLLKLVSAQNKTQKEVADAIGVSPQTFNTWCQGIALPRMGKVQKLADYFGVNKSDLIEEKEDTVEETYYFDEKTKEIAQAIRKNKELFAFFESSRKSAQLQRFLAYYNALNSKGKSEATKRVQELTFLPQYATDNLALLNAAHAIENASEEDKEYDDDIMNDENF